MTFITGITECYGRITTEGYLFCDISFPSTEFLEWLWEFKPDYWHEEYWNEDPENTHIIIIKEPARQMLFKMRWWTDAECSMWDQGERTLVEMLDRYSVGPYEHNATEEEKTGYTILLHT